MSRSMFGSGVALVFLLGFGSPGFVRCAEPAEEDPFGAALVAPAEPSEPVPPPEPAQQQPAAEPEENDPVVRTVRSTKPARPDELIWAARTVLDVGRPEESRKYLQQLLGCQLDAAALAALYQEFGSALFVRFASEPQIQPEGKEVGQSVLDATRQVRSDPQRLEGLIAGLSDANVQTRRLAMADLRESGDAAAVALIRVLADPQRAAEQSTALQALVALGSMSEAPLLGALQARQSEVRRLAATALGRLESRAAIPFLLRPLLDPQTPPDERRACEEAFRQMVGSVPDLAEAQRFLTRAIRRNMASQLAAPSDVQEMPVAWLWDDQQHTVAAHPMEDAALSRWTTQRLAQDLYDLLPESTEARTLWLAALLEWAQVDAGLDTAPAPGVTPAGSRAAATGTAAVEEALAFALEQGQVSAAVGALSVLQTIGDERLLWGAGGVPRTVARALRHPDLRVRCTAARTVIAWDPATPFAGSSHLVEVLAHCARAVGERRVIVAHPQTDFARDIAGMLVELGFQAEIAVTGDSLVKQAVASPDCEAILVSDAIDNAPVKEVVQHLRHDARTARLPIGILTREAYLPEMERFAEGDPWTRAFPRAHDMMGIMLQMRQLLALQDATAITADSRLQWAQMALDYFARVAADTRHYLFPEVFAQEETLIAALAHPGLSARAAQVLGALGSPRAQQALVQLASQNDRGLPQRRSAAAGFALAVERRGLLLSRPEILTQYDRYNRSGGLDRETQQVLGSLLDSIEAPSRTKQ